jgi:O-acetyl-ADP-ribose deacetylase (regulator of RNase III)
MERAAPVAVGAVRGALATARSVELVRFVCFSAADLAVYERALGGRRAVI